MLLLVPAVLAVLLRVLCQITNVIALFRYINLSKGIMLEVFTKMMIMMPMVLSGLRPSFIHRILGRFRLNLEARNGVKAAKMDSKRTSLGAKMEFKVIRQ